MRAVRLVLTVVLVLVTGWGTAAIWVDGPASRPLAGVIAAAFALASGASLTVLRPPYLGLTASALLCAGVVGWWLGIEPSNDRDWLADVARPPRARLEGSSLTIENVRHFAYRSATDWDAPGPTLRIHAGLEDFDDLVADLDAGFSRLNQATGGD